MSISLLSFPDYRPYTNVQPFTVRDGATYLLQIESLIGWIRNSLVPHIDKEIEELTQNWKDTSGELVAAWETMRAELVAKVDTAVAQMGDAVSEAQAAKVAAEAARDLAAIYASQAEQIQDIAITTIYNDQTSEFRKAVESNSVRIAEDANDPGTFIVTTLDFVNLNVVPDPADPGFFIKEES